MQSDTVQVPRAVIEALLAYLVQRPYREVAEGVTALVGAVRAAAAAETDPASQPQP